MHRFIFQKEQNPSYLVCTILYNNDNLFSLTKQEKATKKAVLSIMNLRFTKAERLTKKKEFDGVFNGGKIFKNEKVVLYVIPNNLPYTRLGLVVSKKIGNAVKRNRAKRLLREAYRLNKHVLIVHVDMIAIPRHPFSFNLKLSDIVGGFEELLLQINKAFL